MIAGDNYDPKAGEDIVKIPRWRRDEPWSSGTRKEMQKGSAVCCLQRR
jgi:hypothetical protein